MPGTRLPKLRRSSHARLAKHKSRSSRRGWIRSEIEGDTQLELEIPGPMWVSRNMSATRDRSSQVEPKAEWETPVWWALLEAQVSDP